MTEGEVIRFIQKGIGEDLVRKLKEKELILLEILPPAVVDTIEEYIDKVARV